MQNTKLTIAYDGTRYYGWQRLGDTEQTIQGKIESVLSKMTNQRIELVGSGRTDGGVHARNQVANFKMTANFSPQQIVDYCYQYLPMDIAVKQAEIVPDHFHARYLVKQKQYIYQIDNGRCHDIFDRKYRYHISSPLDLDAIYKASRYLLGEQDFQSFTSMKSKKKSTVRTIFDIRIQQSGSSIDLIFEGNGFLHNMIRIITGTFIEVGLKQRSIEEIPLILNQKKRSVAGPTVPPHGLFLEKVFYE